MSTKALGAEYMADEPVELASPPCSLHEIDPAYSGLGHPTMAEAIMSDEPTAASLSGASAVTLRLDAELLAALDQWVVDRAQGMSRAEAATDALRDWLGGRGYLEHGETPERAD